MSLPSTWRVTAAAFAFAALTVAPSAADATSRSLPAQAASRPHRTDDVQILGLNETHGQLTPLRRSGRLAGGAATLAAYLEREEAENSRTLILDSGDFMQGPAISSYFVGESTVDVFNYIGVDAVAVGNHEFDWGQDVLAERMDQATFPFLAANIVDASGAAPHGILPYVVKKLKGVKVGVIGLANPETKSVTLPAATEGLTFLDPAASAEAVNHYVGDLVSKGVETIVVLAHQGLETATTGPLAGIVAGLDPEVDLVLGGHIPLEFNTVINGIPVVQAFGNTRGYSDVTLTVDRATKDVVAVKAELDTTYIDEIAPKPEVQAIVDRYQAELTAALGAVVGAATTPILRGTTRNVESEMGNLVTDAMRAYVPGVDVALTNAGGLRADIDAGEIRLEEIYNVLPFNNTLVLMNLSGAQLRQVLETEGAPGGFAGAVQVSGIQWSFDPAQPVGTRVTSVTVNGVPLDPATSYRVATNNFMAAGGDQFATLTQGTSVVDTGVNLVDTVVRYLAASSPIDPQVEGRLTVVGA